MRIILFIHIFLSVWKKFNFIADTNTLKEEAQIALNDRNYKKAINIYTELYHEYQVKDESLKLNLGHCYFNINDTVNAKMYYSELTSAKNIKIRSLANQQMGVVAARNNQTKTALYFLKEAIIADPENEIARYNFELLKKHLESQSMVRTHGSSPLSKKQGDQISSNQPQPSNSSNEESSASVGKNHSSQGKEQQENTMKNELESSPNGNNDIISYTTKKRLQQMNLSQEKARKLLEAMKREEIQYLQQKQKR